MLKNIHWILQSNLVKQNVLEDVKAVLTEHHVSFEEVNVIPFSDELPVFRESGTNTVFYGSTTLILNAYKKYGGGNGIFYDANTFTMQTYLKNWGKRMLNADAIISNFPDFALRHKTSAADRRWFVRPDSDDKAFSGRAMTMAEILAFATELEHSNNPYLTLKTLCLFSTLKPIEKEWRLFIQGKDVISACRYAEHGSISVSEQDVPQAMLEFAKESCSVFTPSEVFVMDVALSEAGYFIIECNCFNDSGFYKHDIKKVITSVNNYLLKNQS